MLTYTLSFLPKRSNPLFIAAEKFSFHLTRVGSWLNENSCVQILWENFSKNSQNHFDLSVLHAGVYAHLRVGPLGFDLLSHLLSIAQQVITMHALQVEQTNTHSSHNRVRHNNNKNTPCTPRFFLCDSKNYRNTPLGSYYLIIMLFNHLEGHQINSTQRKTGHWPKKKKKRNFNIFHQIISGTLICILNVS